MKVTVCPRCGTTIEEFRRTSLLGCAECYNCFREEIFGMIRMTQGKTRHVGKSPAEAEEKHSLVLEQELLKENIERALKEKNFEEAETLRKRLLACNRALDRMGMADEK